MAMLAPMLTGAALATCVYCAAANAFFWLCDPQNAGLLPGESPWPPVASVAAVYALLAALAWSQRRDPAGATVVFVACLLAAAFLLFFPGRDVSGAATVPNYYNQVMRLGSLMGGVGQAACLVVATALLLVRRVGRWILARRVVAS